MVGALKVVSVEKGYDPGDFTLCALGGAGPMHAGELMTLLGAARVLVPRHPGILCAIGLLTTDQRYDFVRTCVQRDGAYDIQRLAATYDELDREAHERLAAERVAPASRRLVRAADLRYERQGVELTVPFGAEVVDATSVAALVERFHVTHERLYTFCDRDAPVEIINLRIEATGQIPHPRMPELDAVSPGSTPDPRGLREIVLHGTTVAPAPVYRREMLRAGHRIDGPAVVDQLDTTTVIHAGHHCVVDEHGNLIMQRDDASHRGDVR
jgi:N-methylhydantoinase A